MGQVVVMTKRAKVEQLQAMVDQLQFERNNAVEEKCRMENSRGAWRALALLMVLAYGLLLIAHWVVDGT